MHVIVSLRAEPLHPCARYTITAEPSNVVSRGIYARLRTTISSLLRCPGQSIAILPLSKPVRRNLVSAARVYKRELTCVESRPRHRIPTILPTQYSWDSSISVTALPCGCMIALTSSQELCANNSRMHTLIINFEGVRLAFVVSHYDRRRPHRNIKPTTR